MRDLSFTCAIRKTECDERVILKRLKIWRDPEARSGPENMAVDEWLFRNAGEVPLLRLYGWRGDWVSLGYFQSLAAAREIFGIEPQVVRRWTGGGVVDHRADATYTLVIPREEELARRRGSESYGVIHRALAESMRDFGMVCALTGEDSESDSAACFQKPVRCDIIGAEGEKLAGAGQRRGRAGILHQGSVVAPAEAFEKLGPHLADDREEVFFNNLPGLPDLIARYQDTDWLGRIP